MQDGITRAVYEKTLEKRPAGVWGSSADEGEGDYDQSAPPSGVRFVALSAGVFHTCGIREDSGEVVCWGLGSDPNADESLVGDDYDQSTPPLGVRFSALNTGGFHTCGIREDTGEAACWGDSPANQIAPPSGKFRIGAGD